MKRKRFLAFVPALMGMILSGCSPEIDDFCEHKNVIQEHDSENHWDICQDCGEKINVKKHTYKNDESKNAENKEATCTEAGWIWKKCACGQECKKEVEALDHSYTKVKSTTATCTKAGENTMECSRCGVESPTKVAQAALNHDYVKDTNQEGTLAPTCEGIGTQYNKCSRCGDRQLVNSPALGHNFKEDGTCENEGCNVKRYAWAATDVTAATKAPSAFTQAGSEEAEPNYVDNGDGSVSFYGRPKGNAIVLPATQEAHTSVYDANVEGSFIEYEFTAPKSVNQVKLMADIEPAAYLDSAGGMFLSAASGNDWTPGLEGENVIPEFRYDIYINGVKVELNAAKNVSGAQGRDWYEIPLKNRVNLLANQKYTIKIVMTGGWVHKFYSFAFLTPPAHTHEYVKDTTKSVEPTCTEKGLFYGVCECGLVEQHEVNATDHHWVDAEDELNVTATCLTGGKQKQVCDNPGCTETKFADLPALGHDFQQVGEPITAEGLSTVYKEQCERDGLYRYRINAQDVSGESDMNKRIVGEGEEAYEEPNYKLNNDGSVCFWGRAIHNNQDLDTSGQTRKQGVPSFYLGLYDENIYGSYFEYKFVVGEDGIKGDLVCEMAQSQYLSGSMFQSDISSDWTPGYKNANGDCYTNRYIVLIDGVEAEQDFTKDTTNVSMIGGWSYTPANHKQWYTFPLANEINLNPGEHTIRFVMAAGNICNFYNISIQENNSDIIVP